MKSVRAVIRGRVQGVWFRAHTHQCATKLGVAGFVRNLPDGSVELVAEGKDEAVNALIDWARAGPPLASVTSVEVEDLHESGGFEAFDIRH